jgi:low affinity Fe/Cu permease
MLETEGRQEMALIDYAIQDIERRMNEQYARIDEAKQALVFLQREKEQILEEAAAAAAAKAARDEATRTAVVDRSVAKIDGLH